MVHQHIIFFMKCHFLGSGELYVNHDHNGLNWLSTYCFRCHIYLWESGCSALAHIKTEARNQRIVEHDKKINTVKHSSTNFEVGHTVAKSTVALKMFVKFNFCLKFNVMKCIFVVQMLW